MLEAPCACCQRIVPPGLPRGKAEFSPCLIRESIHRRSCKPAFQAPDGGPAMQLLPNCRKGFLLLPYRCWISLRMESIVDGLAPYESRDGRLSLPVVSTSCSSCRNNRRMGSMGGGVCCPASHGAVEEAHSLPASSSSSAGVPPGSVSAEGVEGSHSWLSASSSPVDVSACSTTGGAGDGVQSWPAVSTFCSSSSLCSNNRRMGSIEHGSRCSPPNEVGGGVRSLLAPSAPCSNNRRIGPIEHCSRCSAPDAGRGGAQSLPAIPTPTSPCLS
jgi:hypothetical protein